MKPTPQRCGETSYREGDSSPELSSKSLQGATNLQLHILHLHIYVYRQNIMHLVIYIYVYIYVIICIYIIYIYILHNSSIDWISNIFYFYVIVVSSCRYILSTPGESHTQKQADCHHPPLPSSRPVQRPAPLQPVHSHGLVWSMAWCVDVWELLQ